jgi:glucose/mannose-6-phosphate isomerase
MQVPGGFQPRAAIGYMVGATLRILESANAVPDQRLAFVEAIELAERAVAPGSAAWEDARKVADGLRGRIPIIYGSTGLTAPVAQRWKTQINENAKVPAWWSLLPELDHNEITGWETMPELTRESLGIAALRDRDDHRRIESRLAHTTRLTQDAVPWAAEVHSSGDSLLARLVSLTVVGDLVSLMMAEDAGTDPVPVETIERLKRLLAEEEK